MTGRKGGFGVLLLLSLVATGLGAQTATTAPVRPGDVLRMKIYLEPEMSGDFQVDEKGNVTLPRLGVLPVSTWPADSIRPRLVKGYNEFLVNPAIDLTILRRISVTGSVMRPNLYPVDPTMSISDALALAGGPSPDGRRDRVELRRGGAKVEANLAVDAKVADLKLQSGDQLFVPQRSWLSRNTWIVSTLIGAVATVTTIVITR